VSRGRRVVGGSRGMLGARPQRDRTPNRSAADRALARLEALVDELGPRDGAARWVNELPPELLRVFALPWALAVARRYARQVEETRALDDGGDA
jgi:hypothetical protein